MQSFDSFLDVREVEIDVTGTLADTMVVRSTLRSLWSLSQT